VCLQAACSLWYHKAARSEGTRTIAKWRESYQSYGCSIIYFSVLRASERRCVYFLHSFRFVSSLSLLTNFTFLFISSFRFLFPYFLLFQFFLVSFFVCSCIFILFLYFLFFFFSVFICPCPSSAVGPSYLSFSYKLHCTRSSCYEQIIQTKC